MPVCPHECIRRLRAQPRVGRREAAALPRRGSPTIERYGGRYRVVSGPAELLEGEWRPEALVIFEFGSHEQALAWWSSEEYAPLKTLRREAAVYNMVLVEGLA